MLIIRNLNLIIIQSWRYLYHATEKKFNSYCVSSRKYMYIHTLPNRKDYFQHPPSPPLKFHFSFNHFFKFFYLRKKTREFQFPLWGEFGYFPKLYIVSKGLCMLAYQRSQWFIDINSCRSLSFFHHLIYSAKTLFKSNEL